MHDLGYMLHRATSLLDRRLTLELQPLGLTPRQAAVLRVLGDRDDLQVGVVADALGIDRPTMTGVVERLGRDGWLESRANPADGRSRLLALTPQARLALPELHAASCHAAHGATAALDPGVLEDLHRSLGALVRSLEAPPAEGTGA